MGEEGEGMECAECECERADVFCCTESLPYCDSCSHKIHSKKARSHHQIILIDTCDKCLTRTANLQCVECLKQNDFFVLCTKCSKYIHSVPSESGHRITTLALRNVVKSENQFPVNKESKRKSGKISNPEQEEIPEKRVTLASSLPRRNIRRTASSRGFGPVDIHDSSSDSEGNEESDSCYSDFEEESGFRRINRGNVSVEAFVVKVEEEEGDFAGGRSAGQEESVGVNERIRKMLELGLRPDTPEIEAQQALKNAYRLLTKYNLQQAEVMNGALKDSDALAGGMSVVELRSKAKIDRIERIQRWAFELACVIAYNFDTKYFTRNHTRRDRHLQVVFYGIKQNVDCSGFAFAATFNRITIMSANYNPSETTADKENKKPSTQSSYTRIARNSYKLGIVTGLRDAVKRSSGTKRIENKQEAAMQALVLHSKEVGKAYIKEKLGIELENLKARRGFIAGRRESAWSLEGFAQGKMDSKQIDINQKALPTNHREKS